MAALFGGTFDTRQKRERRVRVALGHEQLSVAMALTAPSHNRTVQNRAPRCHTIATRAPPSGHAHRWRGVVCW